MNFYSVAFTLTSAILMTFRIYAQGYTVHGCKDARVRLNCRSGTVLVSEVFLADSSCSGSSCCPRQNDCRGTPSANYRGYVLRTCNGKASCLVNVEIRNIGCSIIGPNNDYVNISYECQAASTTTVATLPSILPRMAIFSDSLLSSTRTTEGVVQLTSKLNGESAVSTEKEKDEGIEVETTAALNQSEVGTTSLAAKPGLEFIMTTKDLPDGEKEAQMQKFNEDPQNPDRTTIMTALIVGGIVIVTTVISAAVVMALKKRRIPKKDQSYEMPNVNVVAVTDGGEDNCRSSNFYDFIPDFRDSGHCSNREEEEGDVAKENEYLKPMTDDEERPYDWIP